ncbi:MAG: NADPH:quinone reductase [Planctomycetota bacterium]
MKAATVRRTGDPDVIEVIEMPPPDPGPGQVRIRVEAAAINPIDTYVRSGAVAMDLPTPFIPGCDAAGIVEAVGPDSKRFAVGDRVWCTNQGLLGRQGTLAEQIVVNEAWVFSLPESVSAEDAAACALVGVTAHLGLYREARLEAGETILVIGGAGGVGSMVVQMAALSGARVIATAGSKPKEAWLDSIGTDAVVRYDQESIADRVRELAPDGVNVFWETRRDPDFDIAVDLLASRGRMVLMAGRKARPAFPVGPFYVKECSLHGFVMFKATPIEMRAAADDITRWLAAGKLQANIGARFKLEEAARAHALQENATLAQSESLQGKIIVTME